MKQNKRPFTHTQLEPMTAEDFMASTPAVDPLLRLADILATYLAHQPTERFEVTGRARDLEEIFWKVSNHLQEQLLPKEK